MFQCNARAAVMGIGPLYDTVFHRACEAAFAKALAGPPAVHMLAGHVGSGKTTAVKHWLHTVKHNGASIGAVSYVPAAAALDKLNHNNKNLAAVWSAVHAEIRRGKNADNPEACVRKSILVFDDVHDLLASGDSRASAWADGVKELLFTAQAARKPLTVLCLGANELTLSLPSVLPAMQRVHVPALLPNDVEAARSIMHTSSSCVPNTARDALYNRVLQEMLFEVGATPAALAVWHRHRPVTLRNSGRLLHVVRKVLRGKNTALAHALKDCQASKFTWALQDVCWDAVGQGAWNSKLQPALFADIDEARLRDPLLAELSQEQLHKQLLVLCDRRFLMHDAGLIYPAAVRLLFD